MYLVSVKNDNLVITSNGETTTYRIIEVKARGKEDELADFSNGMQDYFSLGNDDWDESLAMVTLTFDYVKGEQSINKIKGMAKMIIEEINNKELKK